MLLQLRREVDELKRMCNAKTLPSGLLPSQTDSRPASTALTLKGDFIDADGVELCDAEEWADDMDEKISATTNPINRMERELIRKTLEECHYHRKKAAEQLNISERTLYRKIKEYGLE